MCSIALSNYISLGLSSDLMKSIEVDESLAVFNSNVLFKRNHPSVKFKQQDEKSA